MISEFFSKLSAVCSHQWTRPFDSAVGGAGRPGSGPCWLDCSETVLLSALT